MKTSFIASASAKKSTNIPITKGGVVYHFQPHVVHVQKTPHGVIAHHHTTFGEYSSTKKPQKKDAENEVTHVKPHAQFTSPHTQKTTALESSQIIHTLLFNPESAQSLINVPTDETSIEEQIDSAVQHYETKMGRTIAPKKHHAQPHRHHAQTISVRTSPVRQVIIFGIVAVLFTLPLHTAQLTANAHYLTSQVTRKVKTAIGQMRVGGGAFLAGDASGAHYAFADAATTFKDSEKIMHDFKKEVMLLTTLLPQFDKTLRGASHIASAAHTSNAAISRIVAATDSKNFFEIEEREKLLKTFEEASKELSRAHSALQNVNPDTLPETLGVRVAITKEMLRKIAPAVAAIASSLRLFEDMLVVAPTQTIALIFQNNRELRATGGFWGSFALLTIKNGAIANIEVPKGGTYDLQGGLDRVLAPPAPLQLVRKEWQFQDANWFADFPTSARTAAWFLEHSGYQTPDAVVAITPAVLERILKITGPLTLPEYNRTFTADNVTDELQTLVEITYDKVANTPKKVVGDLLHALIDSLTTLSGDSLIALLDALQLSLIEKDILAFHQNAQMTERINNAGWSGAVKKTDDDYLMVINTNIAGQKTDAMITQDIIKETTIDTEGLTRTTLTIRRTHTGVKGTPFSGVRNVNFMRIMVPEDSVLLDAKGFTYPNESLFKEAATHDTLPTLAEINNSRTIHEQSGTIITKEHGKTVFGNWTMTDPGATTVASLTYTSIVRVKQKNNTRHYNLMVQSQPGVSHTSFTHTLHIPNNWELRATTDTDMDQIESAILNRDLFMGIVATEHLQ